MKLKTLLILGSLVSSLSASADSCQILGEAKATLASCESDVANKNSQIAAEEDAINQLLAELSQPIDYQIRECRQQRRSLRAGIDDLTEINNEINAQIRDNRDDIRDTRSSLRRATAYWECVLADRKNMWVAVGTGESPREAFRNARRESGSMTDMFRKHGYWKPTAFHIGERRNPNGRDRRWLRVHQPAQTRDGIAGRDLGFCFRVFKDQNVAPLSAPNALYAQQ